ncbi:preprotein translocase subunit SecY [[Mycoplasma] mobile]|uniref:Protein translocase subunit SecY n=1 Tax=Mycoplasma mobile (strain ATCC 43663 / 163K / NCTC 11711) TaxID=267748 RepID=Q6KI36_MYCM1|nr:preprotein translocase subunit SecY [[Mycoplasma] mobile]AAT27740.1 preprotein translocase secY subunit [Mycoplasma mobile 163K]
MIPKIKDFFANIPTSIAKYFFILRNAWKDFRKKRALLNKIVFTIFLLSIFAIAGSITLPGVSVGNLDSNTFLGILNLVGGGGLRNFSIVALGISPFITASLVMQILQTKLFPPIYRLSQSGPIGRRKINIITRAITIFLGVVQSMTIVSALSAQNSFISLTNEFNVFWYQFIILPVILIAGTVFSIFIGDQITDKGVGNGTTLLIFTGIVITLPTQFTATFNALVGEQQRVSSLSNGIVTFISYVFGFIILMYIIGFVYNAERRIPIQQVGAGRAKNEKELSYLPIKINPGGISPIIFALIIISFPQLFASVFPISNPFRIWVESNLRPNNTIGFILFISITFIFAIFFGLQQSKVDKIAEDFAKNSTFIPGIKPGQETETYLTGIVLRLCFFSAFYLIIIGGMQFAQQLAGVPENISFGGTSVIILVTASYETITQIQARKKSQSLSQKHKKILEVTSKNNNDEKSKGLLW